MNLYPGAPAIAEAFSPEACPLSAIDLIGHLRMEGRLSLREAEILNSAINRGDRDGGSILDRRPCKRPRVDLPRRAEIPAGHDGARA